MSHREPPQSLDAETTLLGCFLGDPDSIDDEADRLPPDDFYAWHNALIYRHLLTMRDENEPINKITLVERLRREGNLEKIGGPRYLSALLEVIPDQASVRWAANTIRDLATHRRIILAAHDLAKSGYSAEEGSETALADALRRVEEVGRGRILEAHENAASAVLGAFNAVFEENDQKCVTTPWPKLNEMVGGFFPGELYVWAGVPKAGKTNLELTLARHIARTCGQVAFFAIEMGQRAIIERRFAMETGIEVKRQRKRDLTAEELGRMSLVLETLQQEALEVYDRPIRSLPLIRLHLRRLARRAPIKAIFLDHVGLLDEVMRENGRSTKAERLERAYGECIRIGIEFDCPVHVIQHINREGARSKAPSVNDIRDGGNPEGLASGVFIVHRDDPQNLDHRAHEGEIIVANSRNGDAGMIPMRYNGARGIWLERTAWNSIPETVYAPSFET